MKIFVVSLERSQARRASMRIQLDEAGVDYEIVNAVDGSLLSEYEIDEIADPVARARNPRWLNFSAIACAKSHLICYQKILGQGLARALILEDDMIINTDLAALLSSAEELKINPSSVILLYYRAELGRTAKLKIIQDKIVDSGYALAAPCSIEDVPSCAGAYIITREACQSLCNCNSPIVVAADDWKAFLVNGSLEKVYTIYPRVCSGAEFDSTIDYAQSYYHPMLYGIRSLLLKLPFIGLLKRSRRKKIEESMSSFEVTC